MAGRPVLPSGVGYEDFVLDSLFGDDLPPDVFGGGDPMGSAPPVDGQAVADEMPDGAPDAPDGVPPEDAPPDVSEAETGPPDNVPPDIVPPDVGGSPELPGDATENALPAAAHSRAADASPLSHVEEQANIADFSLSEPPSLPSQAALKAKEVAAPEGEDFPGPPGDAGMPENPGKPADAGPPETVDVGELSQADENVPVDLPDVADIFIA